MGLLLRLLRLRLTAGNPGLQALGLPGATFEDAEATSGNGKSCVLQALGLPGLFLRLPRPFVRTGNPGLHALGAPGAITEAVEATSAKEKSWVEVSGAISGAIEGTSENRIRLRRGDPWLQV